MVSCNRLSNIFLYLLSYVLATATARVVSQGDAALHARTLRPLPGHAELPRGLNHSEDKRLSASTTELWRRTTGRASHRLSRTEFFSHVKHEPGEVLVWKYYNPSGVRGKMMRALDEPQLQSGHVAVILTSLDRSERFRIRQVEAWGGTPNVAKLIAGTRLIITEMEPHYEDLKGGKAEGLRLEYMGRTTIRGAFDEVMRKFKEISLAYREKYKTFKLLERNCRSFADTLIREARTNKRPPGYNVDSALRMEKVKRAMGSYG